MDDELLIGLSVENARERVSPSDVRVVVQDGVHVAVTADWRPNRINVEVRDDRIVGRG